MSTSTAWTFERRRRRTYMLYIHKYCSCILPSNSLGCKARFWLFKPPSKGAKHKLVWNQDLFGCHKTSNWDFPRLFQLAWSKEKVVRRFICHYYFTQFSLYFKQIQRGVGQVSQISVIHQISWEVPLANTAKTSLFKIFKSGIRIQCTCGIYNSNVVFFLSRL